MYILLLFTLYNTQSNQFLSIASLDIVNILISVGFEITINYSNIDYPLAFAKGEFFLEICNCFSFL